MQGIEQRLRLLLPDGLALIGAELLDLALDLVDPTELLQRELGDLALVRCVQIEELAPRVRLMRACTFKRCRGHQRLTDPREFLMGQFAAGHEQYANLRAVE